MDSSNLDRAQAKQISESLDAPTNYLIRLCDRMKDKGFPPDDELFRLARAAHEAVNRLRLKAHYMSCTGVGNAAISEGEASS